MDSNKLLIVIRDIHARVHLKKVLLDYCLHLSYIVYSVHIICCSNSNNWICVHKLFKILFSVSVRIRGISLCNGCKKLRFVNRSDLRRCTNDREWVGLVK